MKGIKRFYERRFSWWLTFTGEMIFNPKYYDYTAGRIEVYNDNIDTPYAQDEYRIFTKDAKRFYSFIEQHEFKNGERLYVSAEFKRQNLIRKIK